MMVIISSANGENDEKKKQFKKMIIIIRRQMRMKMIWLAARIILLSQEAISFIMIIIMKVTWTFWSQSDQGKPEGSNVIIKRRKNSLFYFKEKDKIFVNEGNWVKRRENARRINHSLNPCLLCALVFMPQCKWYLINSIFDF